MCARVRRKMAKKKGFMSRLIEGPERSENYARSTLPSNRWQLGWDIIKTNFGKIVMLNLILVVFLIPVILLLILRSGNIAFWATGVPFDNFMSYPYIGSLNGASESILVQANTQILVFLPLCAIILAVGLSGVLYILRNMVWTEGVFVGSDFWRGVKKNFWIVMMTLFIYTVILYLGIMSVSFSNLMIATGAANTTLLQIAKILTIIMLAYITIMAMHMLTMSVTYELTFFKLVRNAFILTLSLLPTNIFFTAFAFVTILLYMIMPMLGIIVAILVGVSGGLLVWTVYSHWIYDKFINEKVPGAKKNRGIYEKPNAQTFAEDLSRLGQQTFDTTYLNKRPVKPITDYDVEIVELPTSFNRDDLRRLEESKAAMRRDSDKYVEDVLAGKLKQDDLSMFKEAEDATDAADEAEVNTAEAQVKENE